MSWFTWLSFSGPETTVTDVKDSQSSKQTTENTSETLATSEMQQQKPDTFATTTDAEIQTQAELGFTNTNTNQLPSINNLTIKTFLAGTTDNEGDLPQEPCLDVHLPLDKPRLVREQYVGQMLPVEPIEEPIADSVQQEELEELNRSNEQVFAELQIIRKEASSLRVELENATQQIESAKQEMEALKKVDEKEVKPTSEDKDEALRNKLKALEKENQILQRNLTHSRLLYQQLNTKYIGKIEKAKGLRSSLEEEVTDLRSVNLRLQKRLDFSQTQNGRKKPTKKQRKAQTKHLHNGMDDCLEQNTDEIDD
jgi:hypothetical protein